MEYPSWRNYRRKSSDTFDIYIFNACFRLEYIAASFKTTDIIIIIIMIKKTQQSTWESRFVSTNITLAINVKVIWEVFTKAIKQFVNLPDHLFDFKN